MKSIAFPIAFIVFALASPSMSLAQVPDPFKDYEQQTQMGSTEPEPPKPRFEDEAHLVEGQALLGGGISLAYAASSTDSLDPTLDSVSSHILMFGIEPGVGYFALDQLELTLNLGYLLLTKPVASQETGVEHDLFLEVGALYHHELGRLSIHGGTSIGGYFGFTSRERPTLPEEPVDGQLGGFLWTTRLGGSYFVQNHLLLRLDVALRLMADSESFVAIPQDASHTQFHVGLWLGAFYSL